MKKSKPFRKINYKVTGAFGCEAEGSMIKAIILNEDDDSGIALCYHPPRNKHECGSFEFIRRQNRYWISAFDEKVYSNVGIINHSLKKLLADNEKV